MSAQPLAEPYLDPHRHTLSTCRRIVASWAGSPTAAETERMAQILKKRIAAQGSLDLGRQDRFFLSFADAILTAYYAEKI